MPSEEAGDGVGVESPGAETGDWVGVESLIVKTRDGVGVELPSVVRAKPGRLAVRAESGRLAVRMRVGIETCVVAKMAGRIAMGLI